MECPADLRPALTDGRVVAYVKAGLRHLLQEGLPVTQERLLAAAKANPPPDYPGRAPVRSTLYDNEEAWRLYCQYRTYRPKIRANPSGRHPYHLSQQSRPGLARLLTSDRAKTGRLEQRLTRLLGNDALDADPELCELRRRRSHCWANRPTKTPSKEAERRRSAGQATRKRVAAMLASSPKRSAGSIGRELNLSQSTALRHVQAVRQTQAEQEAVPALLIRLDKLTLVKAIAVERDYHRALKDLHGRQALPLLRQARAALIAGAPMPVPGEQPPPGNERPRNGPPR